VPVTTDVCKYAPGFSTDCFYLKRVDVISTCGDGAIKLVELEKAARWACEYIDGILANKNGECFGSGTATPCMVNDIAMQLASYKLLTYVYVGNAPNEDDYAEALFTQAKETLKLIKAGELGIILADGTCSPCYPPPDGADGKFTADNDCLKRFFIHPNTPFEQMQHWNDDERPEKTTKFVDCCYDDDPTAVGYCSRCNSCDCKC
jgi:hypothetical protein